MKLQLQKYVDDDVWFAKTERVILLLELVLHCILISI